MMKWILILLLSGCTTYTARVGEAEVKMTYFLQDKTFKSFTYDPNSHKIVIKNYGSETSQIVESAIRAALP